MRLEQIPPPAIYRLSFYLRQLEDFKRVSRQTISSKQLGQALGYTDAQVRKDFAYFGQFGHPGIGYRVDELVGQLKKILGTDKIWKVLLVGAGNLGRALVAYKGFAAKGFELAAVFDSDPSKQGLAFGGQKVRPISELPDAVRHEQVKLGMMAVPAEAAQSVADELVAAGIKGILNFAPTSLVVPEGVSVQGVDLAVQLEQLSFRMSLSSNDSE